MSCRFIIFAGGEIDPEIVEVPEKRYLICADRGFMTAEAMGIEPDCVIGDFDSLGYVPKCSNVQIYPSGKDDTDTMLAVKYALENGAEEIHIYGALEGRLDHTFANIQTLLYIEEHGARGVLISKSSRVYIQKSGKSRCYAKRDECYFSVFSYSNESTGVNLTGTEYPLEDAVLKSSFPIGVSNHIIDEYAELSVENGTLLVIESREI